MESRNLSLHLRVLRHRLEGAEGGREGERERGGGEGGRGREGDGGGEGEGREGEGGGGRGREGGRGRGRERGRGDTRLQKGGQLLSHFLVYSGDLLQVLLNKLKLPVARRCRCHGVIEVF